MVGHPANSGCYLALAFSMLGLSGCASDGGLGELAVMAAMVAPIPGDASALLTTAAVAGGAVALASASSTESTPGAVPVPGQTAAYKPDLQVLVTRETPERYRPRSCEYIEMALLEVPGYLAATEPVLQQSGEARKIAASQVWYEKGCTPANLPRGVIGVYMETVDAVSAARISAPTSGVVIGRTGPGSGAQNAGILSGDIIVAVNDQPIVDSIDFRVAVANVPLGTSAQFKYWRAQNFYSVPVLVAASANPLPVLPLAARGSAAPHNAPSAALQGMSLGVVTPSYAKAVGLASAQGAWVTDTVKGSAADQAGIKPLDVILEVSGQEVATAQDVADISSRMRIGYKATVSVWRNQAKRDVQMVLRNE
ncbi:PDZ domain-containing protein [Pseudomonas sp.]|uniref:PDZ domain-containing protein n=1 Tax=Pseudomonas sp. TaxID=306 RepID=UPI0040547E35